MGQDAFLPSESLTRRRPEYTYRTKMNFCSLRLKAGTRLHLTPEKTGSTLRLQEETVLYTLGETNFWYRFYVKGTICFLRKDSSCILEKDSAVFPQIQVSGMKKDARNPLVLRTKYALSLVPARILQMLTEQNVVIRVGTELPDPSYESQGAGGYARFRTDRKEICVKETELPFRLEACLLHEVGHMTGYILYGGDYSGDVPDRCVKEAEGLQLGSRYTTVREYFAEAFTVYVLNPRRLEQKAGNTFQYFFYLLK